MSIPLVNKLELDSINTSIIAIKRLLQQVGISEGGNTIINNNSEGGVPLGTWASFENGIAPSTNWLEAGSTFSSNDYPELYMYLNDTTVPERFDHSKLGQIQAITIPTSSASAMTMEYDGYLLLGSKTSTGVQLYINGNNVFDRKDNSYGSGATITIPFNKGDSVYLNGNPPTTYFYVRYYTQHLFIKATTGADVETAVALSTSWYDALNTKIERSQSYELNEILTGGTWIDGKPIYRKTYIETQTGQWTNNGIIDTISNMDMLVNSQCFVWFTGTYDSYHQNNQADSTRGRFIVNTNTGVVRVQLNGTSSAKLKYGYIEYTKTPDPATRSIPTENTRKVEEETKDDEPIEEPKEEEKK